MTIRQELGKQFEKEAFNILKNKFDKVEWLSKANALSHFDFKVYKGNLFFYVEAKLTNYDLKPILREAQQQADFVIFKNKTGKVKIIKHSQFSKFLTFVKNPKKHNKRFIVNRRIELARKRRLVTITIDNDVHQEIMRLKKERGYPNVDYVLFDILDMGNLKIKN